MRARSFLAVPMIGLVASCAPTLVSGSMTNPAKTSDKVQATQEYDLGPYKENHRYTVSITKWTPESVGAQIKLVDDARCGDPDNYSFALVDDKGARYPFVFENRAQSSEQGRAGMTLTATTIDGRFAAPIGAQTTAMTVQMRSQKGVDCPALDFRWDLK